jgi:hypothetical protein
MRLDSMFKIRLRRGGRQLRKKEVDDIFRFLTKCRECGEQEIWPYGNARSCKLCRECSGKSIPSDVFDKISLHVESLNGSYLKDKEYQKLVREYWRGERNKKGVYEPTIECTKCKQDKPVFEFVALYPPTCYDCRYIINGVHQCRNCKKYISKDLMQDDEYIYNFCPTCREESKIESDFLYFNTVSYRHRKQLLGRIGMDETKESLAFAREVILARRLNIDAKKQLKKQIKEMRNESNRKHVPRKQQKDEKHYEGFVQTGTNDISAAGI